MNSYEVIITEATRSESDKTLVPKYFRRSLSFIICSHIILMYNFFLVSEHSLNMGTDTTDTLY